MPIERSSSPRSVGQPRHRLEGRPGRGVTRRRHRHEAPHVEPEVAQPRHQFAGTPPRRAAVAAGQAGRVDLHEDRRPGREPGDPLALGLAGHALPHAHDRGERAHLVPLHRTEEVPDRPRGRPRRPPPSPRARPRSSRPGPCSPASPRRTDRIGTEALRDADHAHPGGVAAGAARSAAGPRAASARPRR